MLCLRTCGECPRVEAAQACMSLSEECDWMPAIGSVCGDRVDWRAFFTRVVVQEQHRGARLLSERPWIAEFDGLVSAAETDELIRIATAEGETLHCPIPSLVWLY